MNYKPGEMMEMFISLKEFVAKNLRNFGNQQLVILANCGSLLFPLITNFHNLDPNRTNFLYVT